MMRRASEKTRSAFTLIEILVCIGIIAMVLSAAGVAFAEIVRLRGAHDRYRQRAKTAEYLLRSIERDVRNAKGIGDSREELQSGEDTLILNVESGEIVYRIESLSESDETLYRVERIEFLGGQTKRQTLVPPSPLRMRFALEEAAGSQVRSVVTTIDWQEHPKIGISRPTLSLRIVPRNQATTPTAELQGANR